MQYRTYPEAPGLRMFFCQRYSSMLSDRSCADRWRLAKRGEADGPMFLCRGCAIGADHAGEKHQPADVLGHLCVRCNEYAPRLLRGAICISCYNRERECRTGRNGKGSPPRPVVRAWEPDRRKEKGVTVAIFGFRCAVVDTQQVVVVSATWDLEAKLTVLRSNAGMKLCKPVRPGVVTPKQLPLFGAI